MFITIEGGEGSGKSTLIKSLAMHLKLKGAEVFITREPGGTPFGEAIREILLNPDASFTFGSRAEMLLFLAARIQHIEQVIKPRLEKGITVICDRFNDSTIAYQGGARGLGIDEVERICKEACQGFEPDYTFILDISPEKAFQRIRRSKDRLEQEEMDFHHAVRKAFLQLKDKYPKRIHMINADQSPEEVLHSVLEKLK